MNKPALSAQLDVSRSTIDRGIRELEQAGFVERVDDGFEVTQYGDLALQKYEECEDTLDNLQRLCDAIASSSTDPMLDVSLFEDAEIVTPDRHAPHRPISQHETLLESAEYVRTFTPAVTPHRVDLYYDRIVNDGLGGQVVFAEPVVERMITEYREQSHEVLSLDYFDVRKIDVDRQFGLLLADRDAGSEVGVTIYGDRGIEAFVRTAAPAAISWAEDLFQRLWDDSVPPDDVTL